MEGWTLAVEYGSVRDAHYGECGDDNSWYGYGGGGYTYASGWIKTTLNGYGKARLDFGKCNNVVAFSKVRVFLNGNEIGRATGYELSKKIEFDFNDGDTLELNSSLGGMIRFNDFTVLSCVV